LCRRVRGEQEQRSRVKHMDRGEQMYVASELCSVDILQGVEACSRGNDWSTQVCLCSSCKARGGIVLPSAWRTQPSVSPEVRKCGERGKCLNRVGGEEANVVKAGEQGAGWLGSASAM
jgi:hypothetical protein